MKTKWKPKLHGLFWAIVKISHTPEIKSFTYENDIFDKRCVRIGDYFKTKKDAKAKLEQILEVFKK